MIFTNIDALLDYAVERANQHPLNEDETARLGKYLKIYFDALWSQYGSMPRADRLRYAQETLIQAQLQDIAKN